MAIFFAKRPARGGRPTVRRCPILEGLEGRVVLSTISAPAALPATAAQVAGPADEGPSEEIEFVYGHVEVHYWPQD
jgi:hypothetical protein